MVRRSHKGNPELLSLLVELRKTARAHDAPVWKAVAERLERARHQIGPVNVGRLERFAGPGDTVVVPGKLLAAGALTKKLTIGAFAYSEGARSKVHAAGGVALSLPALLKSNPEGMGVRLLG